jgi:CBS domain-containing protein
MKAREIMTKDVVTAGLETTVGEIASLLIEHHISGVPVVTEDRQVVGIVSQSDFLYRAETGSEPKRTWWLTLLTDPDSMARAYTKAHGHRAHEVMSRIVISVTDEAEFGDVAGILNAHGIKRVPVVRDGKLVGIITRTDVVRALAKREASKPAIRSDDVALQKAVLDKMRMQSWLDTAYINVEVAEGVVRLTGFIASEDQRRALRVLAEEISGAGSVKDDMTVGLPTLREF